jgi:hypothetical protein
MAAAVMSCVLDPRKLAKALTRAFSDQGSHPKIDLADPPFRPFSASQICLCHASEHHHCPVRSYRCCRHTIATLPHGGRSRPRCGKASSAQILPAATVDHLGTTFHGFPLCLHRQPNRATAARHQRRECPLRRPLECHQSVTNNRYVEISRNER